jgi:hypothetical protein
MMRGSRGERRCCVALIAERRCNNKLTAKEDAKSKKKSRLLFNALTLRTTTSERVERGGICDVVYLCTTFMQSTRVKSMVATRLPAADHQMPLQRLACPRHMITALPRYVKMPTSCQWHTDTSAGAHSNPTPIPTLDTSHTRERIAYS